MLNFGRQGFRPYRTCGVYVCIRPNLHFPAIHISLVHCGSQEHFLLISSL